MKGGPGRTRVVISERLAIAVTLAIWISSKRLFRNGPSRYVGMASIRHQTNRRLLILSRPQLRPGRDPPAPDVARARASSNSGPLDSGKSRQLSNPYRASAKVSPPARRMIRKIIEYWI